jgi:vitamin B12 transporter
MSDMKPDTTAARIRPALVTLACAVALAIALPAAAQQSTPEVVVTATRVPTDIEAVGSSVTVIDAEEIERRQLRTMTEVLQAVPGTRTVQLGGPGAQTSVFTRGANSNQTLVLIDGLEAVNVSSSNGAFNFADLAPENIERIEVVRGPQSTLYGSDAIGGVINIITRKGEGPMRLTGRAEVGSNATVAPQVALSGSSGALNYTASVRHFRTDGESFTAPRVRAGRDDEADASESTHVSVRLGLQHGQTAETTLFTRYEHVERDSDDVAEDPNSGQQGDNYFIRLQSKASFFDGVWSPLVAVNQTRYRQNFFDDPDSVSGTFRRTKQTGVKNKVETQNDFAFIDDHMFTVGASAETDYLNQNTHTDFSGFIIAGSSDENVDTYGVYLQDRFSLTDSLNGTVGLRRDFHQTFGEKTTWRGTLVYRLVATGTRLKAGYGTGFRAPALFELFGTTANNFGGAFNGNPNLRPEESRGWEAGFEQSLLDRRLRFGATWFRSRIKNLIVCNTTTCNNTSNAATYGAESFVAADLTSTISVRVDYTYTRSENADTKQDLTRRPKHKGNMDVTWSPDFAPARFTVGVARVGRQRDVDFSTGGVAYTPGYTLFNLAADYELNDRVTLTAAADNLLDRDYEVADGLAGRGLFVMFGARARF